METRERERASQVNSQDRGIPGRGNCECRGSYDGKKFGVFWGMKGGEGTGFELQVGGSQIRLAVAGYGMKEPRLQEQEAVE